MISARYMAGYVTERLSGKVTSHAWFGATLCLMSLSKLNQDTLSLVVPSGVFGKAYRRQRMS